MKNFSFVVILLSYLFVNAASAISIEPEANTPKHFLLEIGFAGSVSSDPQIPKIQGGMSGGFLVDLFGQSFITFETGAFVTQQVVGYASPELSKVDDVDISNFHNPKVVGKLLYAGVPLLAKLNLAGRATNTPFILVGASPQLLISKDMSAQGVDAAGNTQAVHPTKSDFDPPSYDLAGIIGFGASFRYSENQTLLLEVTYSKGTVAIDNLGSNLCNQSIQINFGFGVDL